MKLGMNVVLAWVVRILAIAAVAIMIVSFTRPWWIGRFSASEAINIYGWGLRHNLGSFLSGHVAGDVTPAWQAALAWVYVGISGMVALLGAWIRKWWGALLVGLAGLGYIAYAYTALNVVISDRLADFSISLEGVSVVGGGIIINAAQQPGHEMAYIAGGALVTLAVMKAVAAFFTRKKPLKSSLRID
ncbi:MAG: hypothetical protein PHU52_04830 [Dehalococcoidales bacterium]|nr:hypothetical protein [Dehalococcoidales bacterium]